MNFEQQPIDARDVDKGWSHFPGSVMQIVLHNELLRHLNTDRDELEKAEHDDVIRIQARIRARRELLGLLHRNDRPTHARPL